MDVGATGGWLAGSRLEVGATFAGIDFLVLTFAIYTAWIVYAVPPRRSRALWVAAAIVLGHFVYLVVLAYSEKLLDLLPAVVMPPKSDINHVGIWTWTDGLRTLIPWNVPLVAMFIDIVIVAAMVRNSPWLPVIEIDPEKLKRQKAREEKEEVPGTVLAKDMLFRFGPPLLAIAAALLAALAINKSDLKGKKIVAYDQGYLNWLKPDYDSPIDGRYGMLPVFVESLGGEFKHSKDLSETDLAEADVLLLIHPDQPWPKETLDRVWDYVRRGGSLLLAAEPAIREGNSSSSFNDVLGAAGDGSPLRHRRPPRRQLGAILRCPGASRHHGHRRSAEPVRHPVGLFDPHKLARSSGAGGAMGLERSGQRCGCQRHFTL